VAFGSDDKSLIVGGMYAPLMLFDIDPHSWKQRACQIAGRNLTVKEWERYLPDEPYQKTCPQYPEGGGWEKILFKK